MAEYDQYNDFDKQFAIFIHEAVKQSSNVLFSAFDKDGKLLYVNELYKATVGHELRLGHKLPLEKMLTADGIATFVNEVLPGVMSGTPVTSKIAIMHPSGSEKHISFNSFPVSNDEGKIVACACIGVDITREIEAQTKAEWQHAILEYTRDMVASYDKDCNMLYCNPALSKIAFSAGDSDLKSSSDYMTPESVDLVFNKWAPDVFDGAHRSGEVSLISKYGTKVPVSIDLFPIYNYQSRAFGMAASMHDISYVNDNISTSERLQMSLDLAKAGTWEVFVPEKLLYYDERFQAMMHLPEPPLTLTAWADRLSQIVDNVKYGALIDYLRNHFDGSLPSEFKEMRTEFPDGTITYTSCTSKTYYDKDGNPERMLGVTWDVTEGALERFERENQQREQLRAAKFISNFAEPYTRPADMDELITNSLKQLLKFIQADRIDIYLKQSDGSITAKYCLTSSSSVKNLAGHTLDAATIDTIKRLLEIEPYYYARDTAELYKRIPAFDVGAKSVFYIPLSLDKKQIGYMACASISRYATWTDSVINLARMAASIIAGAFAFKTSENALLAAIDEAVDANMAKTRFLSDMSHEIRTPMNAIIGLTEIARSTSDPKKKDAALTSIETSSRHLLSLINDILDISKIESGKIDLANDTFSIEHALMKSCRMVSDKAKAEGISISYQRGANLRWSYLGDETRVSQIFTNLLSNAVKFTPSGGFIKINADERELENGDEAIVVVTVEDSGIGMTEAQINTIFHNCSNPGSQIANSHRVSGLGLSIAKTLAECMGGAITVESALNVGSRFTVELKLHHANREAEFIESFRSKHSNMRILICGASADIKEKFGVLAELFSWTIDVAEGDDDDSESYDLILQLDDAVNLLPAPISVTTLFDMVVAELDSMSAMDGPNEELDLRGYKLLLVEDVALNRDVFIELVKPTGISVESAANGQIAIRMVTDSPGKYDIIMMDVRMPIMNGIEATRIIRAMDDSWAKTVPIVALTANAFREDVDMCISAGMNGHIAKPVDSHRIIESIREHMKFRV